MFAITAAGHRDAWSGEIVWLDDEIGVVVCDGKVVAAVVPLHMLRMMREAGRGGGGGGAYVPQGGSTPIVLPSDGPFDGHFAPTFDGVLAAARPDLVPAYLRAKVRSRVPLKGQP